MSEQVNDYESGPLVVIGTGLAGYSLVREFRKYDKSTRIIMITADDGVSYSKPMLSNGFSKGKTAEQLAMADAGQMAIQLNAEIRTFTRVSGINANDKLVMIGREQLKYSRLVIAAGADVIQLPVTRSDESSAGLSKDRVFSVNDLLDYREIRQSLEGDQRVVILGAGLIGCEFANDLAEVGYQVDIVAPCESLLPSLLPPAAGDALQRGLEKTGIHFHLGHVAEQIDHSDNGVRVSLDNTAVVEADLVLSAVGLLPRKQLAEQATIACGKGIRVNRYLETSSKDIYALGDCAEVEGYSLLYILPLMASARALAKTLIGQPTPVQYGAMPVTVKTPACPVIVCPPPEHAEGSWQCENVSPVDVKASFTNAEGQLLGFALTGSCTSEKQTLTKLVPPLFV